MYDDNIFFFQSSKKNKKEDFLIMVWNEEGFINKKVRETGQNQRAPAALLLENGATKKWFSLVSKGSQLPVITVKQLGTGINQSVTPLRLFVGDSLGLDDRKSLDTVGFLGVTGFDGLYLPLLLYLIVQPFPRSSLSEFNKKLKKKKTVDSCTSFSLKVNIDIQGVMTMTAVDNNTGQSLLLGPSHKTQITRKVFVPTYKTVK